MCTVSATALLLGAINLTNITITVTNVIAVASTATTSITWMCVINSLLTSSIFSWCCDREVRWTTEWHELNTLTLQWAKANIDESR